VPNIVEIGQHMYRHYGKMNTAVEKTGPMLHLQTAAQNMTQYQ